MAESCLRVAIYARVSTADQDCGLQLRELREYAARRGWEVAGEYVDTGWSGAKAKRPALDRLMADAAQHRFDCVAVYKLDRFGRSVLHLNQQLAALTNYGVRFIAISQGLDTDQSNPTSRLLLQILASVAEFERELIRERVSAGLHHAKAKGKHIGRPRRILDRVEVARLRDHEGLSWPKIARRMDAGVGTVVRAYGALNGAPGPCQNPPARAL